MAMSKSSKVFVVAGVLVLLILAYDSVHSFLSEVFGIGIGIGLVFVLFGSILAEILMAVGHAMSIYEDWKDRKKEKKES